MTPQEELAYTRLVELGWSPAAAAGLAGNLVNESGTHLNPTLSHDNGTGYGIAGWRDPQPGQGRWTNLRSFASERGLPVDSLDTQLQFLDHELRTSEKAVGARLKAATDPRRAAATAVDFFRPAGWKRGDPASAHGFDNRRAAAERLYQNFTSAGRAPLDGGFIVSAPNPLRAPLGNGEIEMAELPPVSDAPMLDGNAMPLSMGAAPPMDANDPYAEFSTIVGPAREADPYGDFSSVVEPEAPREGGGLFMNTTAGANDALYSTLGAPVDAATWLINKGVQGTNALAGTEIPEISDPFGGSRSIAKAFGAVGVPDPEGVKAVTPGEKVARAAGSAAGYMVAPELAVRGAMQATGRAVSPVLESVFGSSRTAGDAARNAVIGAGGGAAGEAAAQSVPEPYRPLAEFGGNLVGGGLTAVATEAPRLAAKAAGAARDYVAPLTSGGRERLAAETLSEAASSPAAARDVLEQGAGELVPGSAPTTFQRTGDMGLGGLERVAETRRPELFNQRRAEQNQARVSALEGVQAEGSPEAVVGTLRQNLADLDAMHSQTVARAQSEAQQRVGALGGEGTPEGYGTALRQILDDANAAAKARERALWDAVDPDGQLALPATDIKASANSIVTGLPRAVRPIEGEERAIIETAAGLGDVAPFREVAALRSRVSTAMREELSQRGQTPVYARLSQLRGAIERNIDSAVASKAAQEADAVASGALDPDAAMMARFKNQTDEWYARRNAEAAGLANRAGIAVGFAAGSAASSATFGAAREGGRGFAGASRDSRVSGNQPLTPNFDEAARSRLTAANTATKDRARTFKEGPVGDVLRRAGTQDTFRLPPSEVGRKFFHAGTRGYADIQSLRKAAGTPETNAAIRDYAMMSLRRAAEKPDGTLDTARVAAWRKRHADALRAFPEVDGMLKGPVEASEAVTAAMAAQKRALDEFQAGKVRQLIGLDNPEDVTKAIGGIFTSANPVQIMRQLAKETAKDPAARAGLRKAVADFIRQRLISNTEVATSGTAAIKSDQFQTFMKQAEPALKAIFSGGEITNMKAIADDLQRSARSINAVKLPGRSNSPQDLVAQMRSANQPTSLLSRIMTNATSATATGAAGFATLGPLGALAGIAGLIGSEAVGALRRAGIEKVDDLVTDALLNPDRARVLLARAPEKLTRGQRMTLAQRYRRSWSAAASAASDSQDNEGAH